MAYSSAIRREVRWRVTGTDSWSDIANCSPVAELRLEGLDRAKTYDVEVRDISACGAPSAWVLHAAVVPDVGPGNITLTDLSTAASNAQADATSALNQLTDIASDGKLTAQEKVLSKQDYLTLTGEQAGIDAQASAYAITTEKTAYDNAVSTLKTYLKNNVFVLDASYNWTNVTGTTALVRADWDSNWTAVYTTRQALLNKIYALAKAKADGAQTTADGKIGPGDSITQLSGRTISNITDAGALASKNVANLDADVSDGTNFRRTGSGYVDPSGRPYRLWNGTTIKDAADAVFSGDSLTRLGDRTLENIGDGGGYSRVKSAQVVQGLVSMLGTGRNAITNPTFTQNFSGAANGAAITSGTIIDGWTYDGSSAGAGSPLSVCIPYNGTLRVRTYAGFPIPTGSGGNAAYCRSDRFAVLAGKAYALAINRDAAIVGSINAGITFFHRVYLSFRDSADAIVENQIFDLNVTSTVPATVTGTVPVGAVACYCYLTSYMNNPGAATTLSATYYDVTLNSIEFVQASALDTDVVDGTVYGRTSQSDLYVSGGVNRVGLRVAGSGHRLGDQRNVPSSLSRAYGAVRSATALTVYSTGAVDVNAHTLTMGEAPLNYNAVSNAVTGLTTGQTYQIYTRDNYAGGSPTWLATQSASTANSFDDAYIGGSITVPSSGSGGGGLPGGGGCVHVDSWLQPGLRAKHVRWWQRLDCAHRGRRYRRYRRWQSWPARVRWEPCVRIVADGGAALVCSIHTPFELSDGATMFARDMYGHEVLTDHGWRRVVDVIGVGIQPVMRIHVGGRSYAAGEDPTNRIYSHNPVK